MDEIRTRILVVFLAIFGVTRGIDYECFGGTTGWISMNEEASCIFPLTQFERNFTVAIQICGAVNHSTGYREINWLSAQRLANKIYENNYQRKIYWTGLRVIDLTVLGVESLDAGQAEDQGIMSNFTSIYNPLWAKGEPSKKLSNSDLLSSCVALDLRSTQLFGWRLFPCSTQLPVICQNYACLSGQFRCLDNSKCIPAGFVMDGFDDCLDGSDEKVESSMTNQLLSTANRFFENPVRIEESGVLSPMTMRYGRGDCSHRWTIISPNGKNYVMKIVWHNPSTSTQILIEGSNDTNTLTINPRNTHSFSNLHLPFSSFVLTATGTDTRKEEFQVFFAEYSDFSKCQVDQNGLFELDTSEITKNCNFSYSIGSQEQEDYMAILIVEGNMGTIRYSSGSYPIKKDTLLIIPTSSINIEVNSTWPEDSQKTKMQFYKLPCEVFVTTSNDFEVLWQSSTSRTPKDLSISMVKISEKSGTWEIERIELGNSSWIDIVTHNTTHEIKTSTSFLTNGPSTLNIHQDKLLEFHAIYRQGNQDVKQFDEIVSTTTAVPVTTELVSTEKCKLPTIVNGFIDNTSDDNYSPGTKIQIECNTGFQNALGSLECSEDGNWIGLNATNILECLEIQCPRNTEIETNFGKDPINHEYPVKFGAVRSYENWDHLDFGPFCVCGTENEWNCYNVDNTSYQIACFTPELNDGTFTPIEPTNNTNFNTFPVDATALLTCLFCPEEVTVFVCTSSGEWIEQQSSKPIPHPLCNCDGDPKVEMCSGHGRVIREGSVYTCNCDDGYRMVDLDCVDIDECAENISLCDSTAKCVNTIGGYHCICPKNSKIFEISNNLFHNISTLLPNYSCVEKVCNSQEITSIFQSSTINLTYPRNFREIYQQLEVTGNIFATNLCALPCAVPFEYQCVNETFITNWDIDKHCPNYLEDLTLNGDESYTVNWPTIFSTARVYCKDETKKLIGRPEIFCNSTFQWEILPKCVTQTCSNISQFVQYPLAFSSDSDFTINSQVNFSCADGYSLSGALNMICLEDLSWSEKTLPSCIPLVTQKPMIFENSLIFEEVDLMDRRQLWTWTNDWEWQNGCISHRWFQKISFFTSRQPIELDNEMNEESEIVLDISQCSAEVILSIFTSDAPLDFPPALSKFQEVMKTRQSGSIVTKLRNIKKYLYINLSVQNGSATICSIKMRQAKCKEMRFGKLKLEKSMIGKSVCDGFGRCDSRKGWIIQKCCNQEINNCGNREIVLRDDDASKCSLDDCSNGLCVNSEDGKGFYCKCHEYYTSTGKTCIPDHCSFTNQLRANNYNCKTGNEDDKTISCPRNQQSGKFCEYWGTIYNSSFTYYLDWYNDPNIAYSINSCCSSQLSVLGCPYIPTSTTSYEPDFCAMCNSTNTENCTRDQPYLGSAICNCKEGYYGRTCDVSTFCLSPSGSYNCKNGATCLEESQICLCTDGWIGEFCQYQVTYDSCLLNAPKKCENGVCESSNGENYCNCDAGYLRDSKGLCTVKNLACELNNPCQQNSTCSFSSGKYTCDCKNDWQGDYCQVAPSHDCDVCSIGHSLGCVSTIPDSVQCECAVGYKGSTCSDLIDDCLFDPCFNGGTCSRFNFAKNGQQFETYNCTCSAGYTGSNCELRAVQNCQDDITCQNGGTCDFNENGTAICHCTAQFYGIYCEKSCFDVCAHATGCYQNNSTNQIWCECQNGFTSQYCDVVDNVCITNILTCQNGGTCQYSNQTCSCDSDFSGKFCEIDSDLCRSLDIKCQNGGTCLSQNGTCSCLSGYYGEYCENSIDFCQNYNCYNGGVCSTNQNTCICPPGTTGDHCQDLGQPCKIQLANGTLTDYCQNGGSCFELADGAACDCGNTEYTGRRCETKITFNFNLVFNGLQYAPSIVSNAFSNSSAREFTICSFIQYNYNHNVTTILPQLPPFLAMRSYTGNSRQIVFDNYGFHMCDDQKSCVNGGEDSDFKRISITPNTWHHFCLVSPSINEMSPMYTGYLDGVKVIEQYADRFDPQFYGYLILAPQDLASQDNLFEGMISMTQMYIIRLNETQIGKIAFDCYDTMREDEQLLRNMVLKWESNFTRVSTNNPGVYTDPAGICSSVKCMFGRQLNNAQKSCEKDRIAPSVWRCPTDISIQTSEDFVKVEWNDTDISFFDNIGVVRIISNYVNGQQFGIGISTVRYIAFDAAGNSAQCEFNVIIIQRTCPLNYQIVAPNAQIQFVTNSGPYSPISAIVECDDINYPPIDNQPMFYTCNLLGGYNYGGWVGGTKYYLPACGMTSNARQIVNGTIVSDGGEDDTCEQVSNKLRTTLWNSIDCDKAMCRVKILPTCGSGTVEKRRDTVEAIALQYELETQQTYENIAPTILSSLQQNFNLVRQTSSITCNSTFPIQTTIDNSTFCISCPEGTFANITECSTCPQNTYRNETGNQLECENCPDGMTTGQNIGAVSMIQCYIDCPIGQFANSSSCQNCPIGTYGNVTGILTCTSCEFDLSTSNDGSTAQSDCNVTCPKGQQMIRSSMIPFCQNCPIGFYKNSTRGACQQCPRGLTTSQTGSISIDNCNILDCIDMNTRRNTNITVSPSVPYDVLCLTCEQGSFQNVTNQDYCMSCSELDTDSDTDTPVTCQSTCSPSTPLVGCNCKLQEGKNSTLIIRNCLVEIHDSPSHADAVAIVLPIVFGVVLLIIATIAYCMRKQIYAWCRKSEQNDNQNVRPGFWNDNIVSRPASGIDFDSGGSQRSIIQRHIAHIPRPNLRIVTNRAELDQLPPLPLSSTLPTENSLQQRVQNWTVNGNGVNSSTRIERRKSTVSTDSSLDSFF